jgi:adenine-specific DNA-methyltransferase
LTVDVKKQLEHIYFNDYYKPGDVEDSTSRFILYVIDIIYKALQRKTPQCSRGQKIARLLQPALDSCNTDWNFLGNLYQDLLLRGSRKRKGQFYTPRYLAGYMADHLFEQIDIIQNPRPRFLDPSCGGGVFLLEMFYRLRDSVMESLEQINRYHPELRLIPSDVNRFALGGLYGLDSDPVGVELAKLNLYIASGADNAIPINIHCADALTITDLPWGAMPFDAVIGNPPYIGHKRLPKEYRDRIKRQYTGILQDKADICYCFIKRGIDLLKPGGMLAYVVPRYLAEAPGAVGIREFMKYNGYMTRLIDFYGNRTLKGIQVDPMVIFYKKTEAPEPHSTEVIRINNYSTKGCKLMDAISMKDPERCINFNTLWENLSPSGWIMASDRQKRLLDGIKAQCECTLGDLVISFQGVITGCDNAFVIEQEQADKMVIDRSLLKKWIKNSHIARYGLKESRLLLIYSDDIDSIQHHPGVFEQIAPYRDRLERRRECVSGLRKWYQLQWGRKAANFERTKVVYPYKAADNRFAVDYGHHYFSADVYSFYVRGGFSDLVTPEYLVGLLNSSLYSFYFKSLGKKLGRDMYEYYPNTVLKLGIKTTIETSQRCKIEELVSNRLLSEQDRQTGIDRIVYQMFGIDQQDKDMIEEFVKRQH